MQAALRKRDLDEQVWTVPALARREDGQSVKIVAQRLLVGRRRLRSVAGQREVIRSPRRVRVRSRLHEGACDVGGVALEIVVVQLLQRVGDPEVYALPSRSRELREDRLPDEFMGEAILQLDIVMLLDDELSHLRLLDRLEEVVRLSVSYCLEHVETEMSTHDCGDRERSTRGLGQAPQSLIDDQPHVPGNVQLVDEQVGAKASNLVEQLTGLGQMAKQLFDKEGVPIAFSVDGGGYFGRRWIPAEPMEHRSHLGDGEPFKAHQIHLMSMQHSGNGGHECVRDIETRVAVRAQEKEGNVLDMLGKMLEQEQRGLVCPL